MTHQCTQLNTLSEKVRKYWEEKQHELQDVLIRFSYAILTDLPDIPSLNKSGILFLMQNTLWFEDFQKPSFFLFKTPPKYEKTLLHMPRQSIEEVQLIRRSRLNEACRGKRASSGFLRKFLQFLGTDPLYLCISGTRENGKSFRYIFRELNEPDAWLHTLQDWKA